MSLSRGVVFISVLAVLLLEPRFIEADLAEPRFIEADEVTDLAAAAGALTQLDGEDGCVDDDGEEGCADGRALDFALGVAVIRTARALRRIFCQRRGGGVRPRQPDKR